MKQTVQRLRSRSHAWHISLRAIAVPKFKKICVGVFCRLKYLKAWLILAGEGDGGKSALM
jgi:hypothetical protein